MSWKCQICLTAQEAGTPLNRYPIPKPNGQTARELSVCKSCLQQQAKGIPFGVILSKAKRQREAERKKLKPVLFGGKWVTPQTLEQAKAEDN